MPTSHIPAQLKAWLPSPGQFRQKDWVTADLRKLQVRDWFTATQDCDKWRSLCHTLVPNSSLNHFLLCVRRVFKIQFGLTHHNYTAERQLPVKDQHKVFDGALDAHGGLEVLVVCFARMKTPVGTSIYYAICSSPPEPITPHRIIFTNLHCCPFHCRLRTRFFLLCTSF